MKRARDIVRVRLPRCDPSNPSHMHGLAEAWGEDARRAIQRGDERTAYLSAELAARFARKMLALMADAPKEPK